MTYAYLMSLLLSLAGLVLADWRWKLALFHDRKRTIKVLVLSVTLFLVWDIAGVALDIFFIGESRYLSGLVLLPDVPLEELLFLTLLSYTILLAWLKFEGKRL